MRLQPLARRRTAGRAWRPSTRIPAAAARDAMLALRRAGAAPRNAIMLADYGGVGDRRGAGRARRCRADPASRRDAPARRCGAAAATRRSRSASSTRTRLDLLARGCERGRANRRPCAAPTECPRLWQESRIAIPDTETYNLDRKQHALSMISSSQRHASNVTLSPARDGIRRRCALFHPRSFSLHCERHASMAREKFYITTAISYPNGKPHIGHAYDGHRDRCDGALPAARRQGRVLPDRHRRARPQDAADGRRRRASRRSELADRNSAIFRAMVEALDGSNDDFIRTTEARHYTRLPGDLEARWRPMATSISDRYAGWYSVRDEAYYDEKETDARRRRRAPRAAGHAGRMDRGGELFLPPVRLSGPAAGASTRPIRTSSARRSAATRSSASSSPA